MNILLIFYTDILTFILFLFNQYMSGNQGTWPGCTSVISLQLADKSAFSSIYFCSAHFSTPPLPFAHLCNGSFHSAWPCRDWMPQVCFLPCPLPPFFSVTIPPPPQSAPVIWLVASRSRCCPVAYKSQSNLDFKGEEVALHRLDWLPHGISRWRIIVFFFSFPAPVGQRC